VSPPTFEVTCTPPTREPTPPLLLICSGQELYLHQPLSRYSGSSFFPVVDFWILGAALFSPAANIILGRNPCLR
jgi:hypothetical protein